MARSSTTAVLTTLVLLGAAVAGGVVYFDVLSDTWSEHGVVVEPAPGPNGEYATIGSGGSVTVSLDEDGVNPRSLTIVRNVFVMRNTGENATRVWVTHGASGAVNVVDERSDRPVLGAANSTVLEPGQRVVATLRIDTRTNATSPQQVLLNELTVHTEPATAPAPADPKPSTVTVTPAESSVDTRPDVLTVDFGAGIGEVNVTLDSIPPSSLSVASSGDESVQPSIRVPNTSGLNDVRVNNTTVDVVVPARTPVTLDATRSAVRSTASVDRERRIALAVDVSVPESLRNHPATMRFRVPRDRFGDTNPADARVGHLTADGWRLLDTRVVNQTDEAVVLSARTPRFSTFAVFTAPGVTYRWGLPDGTSERGAQYRTVFTEPGRHDVSLSVTTDRGAQNTTSGVVLANDQPEVSVMVPDNVTAGDHVTLQTRVTNRYGNVSVSWVFPDGRTANGRTVTHTFDPGSQSVTVHVSDEYGANATATKTVEVAAHGTSDDPEHQVLPADVGTMLVIVTIVGGVVFLAALVGGLYLFATGRFRVGNPDDDLLVAAFRGNASLGSGLEDDVDIEAPLRSPDEPELPSAAEVWATLGDAAPDTSFCGVAVNVPAGLPTGGGRQVSGFSFSVPDLRRRRGPEVTAFHDPTWDSARNRFSIGTVAVTHPDSDLATVEVAIVDRDGDPLARKTIDLAGRGVYRAAPEHVPGVPEAEVDGPGAYEARIRVLDRRSNEITETRSVRIPRGVPGS